jgi:putative holliday junction resolvase
MALDLLQNIIKDCPADRNLMGLDVGKKTIGVALSDSAHRIATPLTTIERKRFRTDLAALEKIIRTYEVRGFVIGYPLNMDGSAGPRCQAVRDFALEFIEQLSPDLKSADGVWVALWDERLSTAAVESFVDNVVEINRRRAKERGIMDKLAAQHILQGALDHMEMSG